MYNVFTDFHHAGLLNSLIMLFEGRLGGKVYRPIGTEWFKEGYWKIYDHPATVEQFLGIGGATPDGTPKLNEVETSMSLPNEGLYHCKDIEGDKTNKAITLDLFFKLPIDIVIASIPAHLEPFKKLCREHPNHPKLIYQIGNAWTIEAGLAPNVMASAIVNDIPNNVHFISYHQEFDLKVFFPTYLAISPEGSEELSPSKNIFSFVNCFGQGAFAEDFALFNEVSRLMPDWDFKSFGGQCRDGTCNGTQELANRMRDAKFIWHTKAGGDGYGHVLHNAAAVGRPIITKKIYYAGKMGEKLMIDGVTCINIDGLTPQQIVDKISNVPAQSYQEMCRATFDNFSKVCNFDQEFEQIKIFLANLV